MSVISGSGGGGPDGNMSASAPRSLRSNPGLPALGGCLVGWDTPHPL